MPLLGKIKELANDSLIEAKLIKGEEGPGKIKKYVDRFTEKASKVDKTELCRMSNQELFFMYIVLTNDNTLSFEETFNYCEEVKKSVNSWTHDKVSSKLIQLVNGMNDDGSLRDYKHLATLTELGLTPVFVTYNLKLVFLFMNSFLKLKKDILTPHEYTKNLTLPQRMQVMKNVYRQSNIKQFVDIAKDCLKHEVADHEHRQFVSSKRIEATNEVISKLEDGSIEEMCEIPNEWHQFLDPNLLESIYQLVLENLNKQKQTLDKEEKELIAKRDKTPLITYLYNAGLNPYSLNEKLETLNNLPNIIEKLEFFKLLNIPINNILTTYYNYLLNITEEKIETLSFFIKNNILSKTRIINNLSILDNDYQKILTNYEILKDIIDFKNIFYNDQILLKDLTSIKEILSVLKEYKLTKNNYIFLLCNYEYLSIYDLVLEHDIPESLFISICETTNPLNTIKRILIMKNIGEAYETPSHFLKKDVTAEHRFIIEDARLDEYLPNIVKETGLDLLSGTKITDITNNQLVRYLDSEYQVDDTYFIGDTTISRPKFLRNFESVNGNPSYLLTSLLSNSIIDESSYYNLINELNSKQLKR